MRNIVYVRPMHFQDRPSYDDFWQAQSEDEAERLVSFLKALGHGSARIVTLREAEDMVKGNG